MATELAQSGRRPDLRALREMLGLTQKEMGEVVGCSGAQISKIESGAQSPGRKLANRLDKIYGIPAEDWDHQEVA